MMRKPKIRIIGWRKVEIRIVRGRKIEIIIRGGQRSNIEIIIMRRWRRRNKNRVFRIFPIVIINAEFFRRRRMS